MFDRRTDLSASQTLNNGDAMLGVTGRIQSEITIQRANRSIRGTIAHHRAEHRCQIDIYASSS